MGIYLLKECLRYKHPVKHIILLFLLLGMLRTHGQTPTSLSIGPYAGMDRIHLNPALGINSSYDWDAALVGAHLFGFSDYGFVRTASLLNLSGQLSQARVIDAQSAIPEQSPVPLVLFDQDGGKKAVALRGRINGPAFSMSLKSGLRVGVFSSMRAHLSSTDIPENFGIYELNRSYDTNIINVDRGSISGATWLEIGATFSKAIGEAAFGFNLKYLRAYEGGFANSDTDADYQFVDSIITVNGIPNFETAFTTSSLNSGNFLPDVNGNGIAIDFGVTYQLDNMNFGISVMDIGVLQFKSNVEIYTPEILANLTTIRTQDFRGFSSVRALIDQLQNDLDITPDVFGVFSIGLPTRISLYGDYVYDERISISANINQRLPVFPNSLKSNNTLVVTPRYETDVYGLYLPVTVYEYRSLRVGTAFRIGPLTIGTDHITSVLFPSEFRGSDFFFTLNIYPFGKTRDPRKARKGKDAMCPMF